MKLLSQTVLIFVLIISCTNGDKILEASFEVDGMSIRGGFLWLGWPNDIGQALDELKEIESHSFDLETRQFFVKYNFKLIDKNKIIHAVEKAGNFIVKDWRITNY